VRLDARAAKHSVTMALGAERPGRRAEAAPEAFRACVGTVRIPPGMAAAAPGTGASMAALSILCASGSRFLLRRVHDRGIVLSLVFFRCCACCRRQAAIRRRVRVVVRLSFATLLCVPPVPANAAHRMLHNTALLRAIPARAGARNHPSYLESSC